MYRKETPESVRNTVKILPDKPGVYQYFDKNDKLIYVGKAKDLKKRVSSYFINKDQGGKVAALVDKICRIEYIVVNSESDALLLENTLIKEHKPHYNVMLKDDKTYPWICISKEEYPKVFSTRKHISKDFYYFGPFSSVKIINALLELMYELYPIRNCRFNINDDVIKSKKIPLCLDYQMKRCKGVCQGLQTKEEYNENINQIKSLIKGHIKPVLQKLNIQMLEYAENLDFKRAQSIKKKIEILKSYQSKSTVVNENINNIDVISSKENDDIIYFNYLRVIDGRITLSHTMEVKPKLDESEADLLETAIYEFRRRFDSNAPEIILGVEPNFALDNIKYHVPKLGDKKSLLELSKKHIQYHIIEKNKRSDLIDPERHSKRLLSTLQDALGMNISPTHIECFDNSNMLGNYPVAAMTVSKNGKLSKKDYRHFNIKTVEGPNDYASMEEIITRRYTRLLEEKQELPKLVIVDGGKGQVSSAYKVFKKLGLENKIYLIGIAERLEEIYKPNDNTPLHIDKRSEALKHIQILRDEAHRFGITHYRKRHIKGLIKTELTDIKGIGEETAITLLKQFKSVKRIKALDLEDLEKAVGKSKGKIVFDYFRLNTIK